MTEALRESIKAKLLAEWLPDKPGGLTGLVELAAKVAAEVAIDGVDCGHAAELERLTVLVSELQASSGGGVEDIDANPDTEFGHGIAQYDCTQCNHVHKIDSRIGIEHLPQYLREQVEKNVEQVAPGDAPGN